MKSSIHKFDSSKESYTKEQCYITETSNSDDDPDVSVAHARVEPSMSTRWHRLHDTTERYCIISGNGVVELGDDMLQSVKAGDVVVIPPMCAQRITNIGDNDLIFLAICSPRFSESNYEDIEQQQREKTDMPGPGPESIPGMEAAVSIGGSGQKAAKASNVSAPAIEIDIYDTDIESTFVSLPAGTDLSTVDFSDLASTGIQQLTIQTRNLKLDPNEPRIGLNHADIVSQINQRGYALHTTNLDTSIDLKG